MLIGFIGSGPVAQNLAKLARFAGHDVVLSSRHPGKALPDFKVTSFSDAAERANIAVIAVPYRVTSELLPQLSHALKGKIVIDATNGLNEDYTPVASVGVEASAGEEIARLLPKSRVVKAFNTIFADVMSANRLDRAGQRATAFVASNDTEARSAVAKLARDLGFDPVEAGPLAMARYLEGMAHLNIQIAFREGAGPNVAFLYHRA